MDKQSYKSKTCYCSDHHLSSGLLLFRCSWTWLVSVTNCLMPKQMLHSTSEVNSINCESGNPNSHLTNTNDKNTDAWAAGVAV